MLTIMILAAGASSRMRGRDKLAEKVDGVPLLARITERALKTGLPVRVIVGPTTLARQNLLGDLPADVYFAPDAKAGMAYSIAAGVAALPDNCAGVMLILADMPELTTADLGALATRWATLPAPAILQATTSDGTPGHPVIFPKAVFPALMRLTGDSGAKPVLKAHPGMLYRHALAADHAAIDLDTPEAWAAWRKRRKAHKI
ncbi:nucleotidyltransferase family protein [Shimia sp. SDUM112013]